MRLLYLYLCVVGAVAFSSSAAAQRATEYTAQHVTEHATEHVIEADSVDTVAEEEIEGTSYDLQLETKAPIPDSANPSLDIVEFSVTNNGADASPQMQLLVNTMTASTVTRAQRELHHVGGTAIPPIPPRGHVTLRVQVPRLADPAACYVGKIVSDSTNVSPLS